MAKRCVADDGFWKRKKCTKDCIYYDTCRLKDNKERLAELEEQEKEYRNQKKHDSGELAIMQGYSIERKIQLTCERIKAWYEWWDGMVYVSFSGGKDSTVLLDLVRNVCGYDDVPAVFVDTGLEYPEIREFVKTFPNVEWLKPKMNFKQVIEQYGYPFFSKENSMAIEASRKYLTKLREKENALTDRQTIEGFYGIADLMGIDRREDKNNPLYQKLKTGAIPSEEIPLRAKQVIGIKGNYSSMYDKTRFNFMLDADFEVSSKCCSVMKKAPAHEYNRRTGRKPMTGQQASESRLRASNWFKNGCNGFYMESPISNPMAFWTEQDVLLYIKTKQLRIASVYGEVVEDLANYEGVEGQMTFSDLDDPMGLELFDADRPPLRTTGCDRTGCMFCGYGCHLDPKGEGRFLRMKTTHPKQYEYLMKPKEEGGLDYKNKIDWINEHGGFEIEY